MRHETKLNLIGIIGPLFGTIPPILLGYYTSDPFWYYVAVIGYHTYRRCNTINQPQTLNNVYLNKPKGPRQMKYPLTIPFAIVIFAVLALGFYEREFIDYRINGCRCTERHYSAFCLGHPAYPRLTPRWVKDRWHLPPASPRRLSDTRPPKVPTQRAIEGFSFFYGDYWEQKCCQCLATLDNPGVKGRRNVHLYSADDKAMTTVPCCIDCWAKLDSPTRKRLVILWFACRDQSEAETGRWDLFPDDEHDMDFRAKILRAVDNPSKRYDTYPGESAPGILLNGERYLD